MAKTKYSGKRRVITHTYLKNAACELVETAEKVEEGNFYTSMMALVAAAFMLEALLNHIGEEKFKSWPAIERITPRGKLDVICEKIKVKPDFGSSPYQSFSVLFGVRNLLAHGKTETLVGTSIQPDSAVGFLSGLETKWEKVCNPTDARKHYEAAVKIAKELWKRAGLPHDPFTVVAHGMYESVVEP